VEGFLDDAQDLPRARGLERRRGAVGVELDGHAVDALEHVGLLAQHALEPVALELRRAQPEDERTQLGQRLTSEIAHALELGTCLVGAAVQQRRRRLGGEVEAEELLADDVVELQREAIALRQDRELAAALVEPGIGDGDGGMGGQQLDELLVMGVEGRGGLLLGQVEGADDALGRDDRDAEEGAHVRMGAGPPAAEAGIAMDVLGAVGARGLQHRAKHPVGAGKGPHGGDELVAHPRDEEAAEAAGAVGDPERGIARLDELARAVDELLEDVVDVQARGHRQHRVADRLQRGTHRLRHGRDDSFGEACRCRGYSSGPRC
jgi:hypothetical protein